MYFEHCQMAWQAMGLSSWLQSPTRHTQSHLHQVYRLQTACGVYVLEHWRLCRVSGFND